ncbi:hypothetical protein SedNR2807_32260 [Citrobacter sedlakii]
MSNIDKQQIRADIARRKAMPDFGIGPDSNIERLRVIHETQRSFGLELVVALLDELAFLDKRNAELNSTLERWAVDRAQSASELDDAEKRIAELSHHLQCAHAFVEHTEAFGHEASNGILCCGDAQWNIDASKSALAAAGKGE